MATFWRSESLEAVTWLASSTVVPTERIGKSCQRVKGCPKDRMKVPSLPSQGCLTNGLSNIHVAQRAEILSGQNEITWLNRPRASEGSEIRRFLSAGLVPFFGLCACDVGIIRIFGSIISNEHHSIRCEVPILCRSVKWTFEVFLYGP